MCSMLPSIELAHCVGDSGIHLSEIGRVYLGVVSQEDDLGSGSCSCYECFHLFWREVLCFVYDEISSC